MCLVDSHCHLSKLDYKNIHKDISDVLRKAHNRGVQSVLSVSTDLSDYDKSVEIVGDNPNVLFSCGVHPCNIHNFDKNQLYDKACNENVVAIGETGLDYYQYVDTKNIQKSAFYEHIAIANKLRKPVIIHSRKAIEDTLLILKKSGVEKCSGVFHCFSEDINVVKIVLNINLYVSFSGMITFRNVDMFKKVIKYIPLDRMLLETDSPYLTPVPYRGCENQPAYIYEIAEYIAHVKNITMDRVARVTTSSFYKLFSIP